MRGKNLRAIGEQEQRLCWLDARRQCPYYTDRERAALAWTEALTAITNAHAPDSVRKKWVDISPEKELSDLTIAIGLINLSNRSAISSRTEPGTYQPANTAVKTAS
jgi:alkylhydroperoxidase family enzyme